MLAFVLGTRWRDCFLVGCACIELHRRYWYESLQDAVYRYIYYDMARVPPHSQAKCMIRPQSRHTIALQLLCGCALPWPLSTSSHSW